MNNPQIDAYIEKSQPFARPILKKLRRLLHQACPEIQETLKWGFPHFEHKGIVAGMAAFKEHATFGFWKQKLMSDPHKLLDGKQPHMARVADVSELPADDILLAYIREAVALNEGGVKLPKKKTPPRPEMPVPDDLMAALRKNKKALATFEGFSPSNRREYIEWITEAKQPATRAKRLTTAIEWMAEGKPRNWKYMRK